MITPPKIENAVHLTRNSVSSERGCARCSATKDGAAVPFAYKNVKGIFDSQ